MRGELYYGTAEGLTWDAVFLDQCEALLATILTQITDAATIAWAPTRPFVPTPGDVQLRFSFHTEVLSTEKPRQGAAQLLIAAEFAPAAILHVLLELEKFYTWCTETTVERHRAADAILRDQRTAAETLRNRLILAKLKQSA